MFSLADVGHSAEALVSDTSGLAQTNQATWELHPASRGQGCAMQASNG